MPTSRSACALRTNYQRFQCDRVNLALTRIYLPPLQTERANNHAHFVGRDVNMAVPLPRDPLLKPAQNFVFFKIAIFRSGCARRGYPPSKYRPRKKYSPTPMSGKKP